MDFTQISLLLVVAATFGVIVKKFKQPVLIGYLFAGLILSWLGFLEHNIIIENLGKIGVALLLFLVGLEMNLKELPTIGKAALYTGIGQIAFTFSIGFAAALLFGFDPLTSAYIAIALSFSSTIIIVKLLSEKNALGSLYGKISVGFLLVQDLVAILILIFLSGLQTGSQNITSYLVMAFKATVLLGGVYLLSKKILPYIFEKYVATSQELLFIVSIAWALGLASLVAGPLGFTLEIGGFLAGLALSNLPEHLEIASRTRPLRDFFLTIFFLGLGANLVVGGIGEVIVPAAIFSILVLIGNPIVVMAVMGFLRFKKRTSFLSSVTVAQISEFSLIVMAMGLSLGHVTEANVAMIVLVAAITMTISTYIILSAEKIYLKLRPMLSIFERKNPAERVITEKKDIKDHVVLVGSLRTGPRLISLFKKKSVPYLIVDFNPQVYKEYAAKKEPILFGDISDPEILDLANIGDSRLVISTIQTLHDNLVLLEYVKRLKNRPTTILTALTRSDAVKMYEKGADYVIVPDVVAGDYLRHLLRTYGMGGKKLKQIGKKHFDRLIFT